MGLEKFVGIELLIARYLAGTADQSEVLELKAWIERSPENRLLFEQTRNIWETSDRQFNYNSIHTDQALKKVLQRIQKQRVKNNLWIQWQKIAAVLLIPLLCGSIFLTLFQIERNKSLSAPVYNELYAALGTRSALKLSDGSSVWLNSGSSLKYPDRFVGKEREVFLSGEAYFEVHSDLSKPFIVHTENLSVKATGTRFCVSDYTKSKATEVTLISGKVFVNKMVNQGEEKKLAELSPGEHLEYNKNSMNLTIIQRDTYEYIAWKDGKLVFRNEPLSIVVEKISQLYNVDIELQGSVLKDYRYRATFQDESLTEILKLLKLSAPIDYIEQKRNPLPDGSFPKKKVIIYPANQ